MNREKGVDMSYSLNKEQSKVIKMTKKSVCRTWNQNLKNHKKKQNAKILLQKEITRAVNGDLPQILVQNKVKKQSSTQKINSFPLKRLYSQRKKKIYDVWA